MVLLRNTALAQRGLIITGVALVALVGVCVRVFVFTPIECWLLCI